MLQIGIVGKDSPIFNYERDEELKKDFLYMIIDNYKEEKINIDFEYMFQDQHSDFKICSSNTTGYYKKTIDYLSKLSLLEIINSQEKLIYFIENGDT